MDWLKELFETPEDAINTALWTAGGFIALAVLAEWGKHFFGPPEQGVIDYRRGGWNRAVSERVPVERGIKGTSKTLEVMAALVRRDHADPLIRQVAERIVAHCPGHGFECEIKAIYDFVQRKITYRRDPADVERVQDARRCLDSGVGDCDDKSILLASLLGSLGHKTRFGLLSNRGDDYSHVFVEVYHAGQWIALDPTPETFRAGQRGLAGYVGKYEIFGR